MSRERESKSEERFESMATVLIASVAVLVAITAFFQNYASNLSDQARRHAQEDAIAATRMELMGAIQYSYHWQGAYQTWYEIDLQRTAAEQAGDTTAVERYTKLKEKIAGVSELLGPKYFDPATNQPNTGEFVADLYLVDATRLTEFYAAESELGNVTNNTADALVVQITLLTVALSLYGLSMALKGGVRWLFIIVGTGIVGFCLLWLGWSMIELWTRPEVNHNAIEAYAEGVGLAYQGKYDEAIAKFNAAIAEKNDYKMAYFGLGDAYYSKRDYAAALVNYEAARKAGLDDVNINWNLGWTYYMTGQYPQAIEADERILSNDPSVLGMRMNEAIAYLAAGDLTNAQRQYDLLNQEAERQVSKAHNNELEPPASLWYYMDAGGVDLQNLIDQLDKEPKDWTQAPALDLIAGDHAAIREFAYQQMVRIKETVVALEYSGRLPIAQETMKVQPFKFGQVTEYNAEGFIVGFEAAPDAVFPYGNETKSVTVEFVYEGAPPTQLVWKVYFNGLESQSLRTVANDDLSSNTTWYKTFGYAYTDAFILAAGEYRVELYADSKLAQTGKFYVK
jgi:tetratricopeptide (TPR) repeat protein